MFHVLGALAEVAFSFFIGQIIGTALFVCIMMGIFLFSV